MHSLSLPINPAMPSLPPIHLHPPNPQTFPPTQLCYCADAHLGQPPADSPGLLGAEVEGQVLLALVELAKVGALLLVHDGEDAGNRLAGRVAATKVGAECRVSVGDSLMTMMVVAALFSSFIVFLLALLPSLLPRPTSMYAPPRSSSRQQPNPLLQYAMSTS